MSFEIGDIVECIDVSNGTHNGLVLGRKYIVYGTKKCCHIINIDIGILTPYDYGIRCSYCYTTLSKIGGDIAWFKSSRFRKIEPSYKVVEVTETIIEEIKELIQN